MYPRFSKRIIIQVIYVMQQQLFNTSELNDRSYFQQSYMGHLEDIQTALKSSRKSENKNKITAEKSALREDQFSDHTEKYSEI